MPVTYKKIASVTVGAGGAATIDIQNIPATYTDLVLKISSRDGSGFSDAYITFNGSTANYTDRLLFGTGSAASSSVPSGTGIIAVANNGSASTASTFSNVEIYIPNYAGSNNKSVSIDAVSENNATAAYAYLAAGLWSDSSAINRIVFTPFSNLVQYSTATLYGISKS